MDKTEALSKLEEINQIVHSSDRLRLSWKTSLWSGAIPLLIGFARLASDLADRHAIPSQIGTLSAFGFLLILLALVIWRRPHDKLERERQSQQPKIHPLVQQAFGVGKAQLFVAMALSLVWWSHFDRAMAIWLITFGLAYNQLGQFVHPIVARYSWALILAGILCAAIAEAGTGETFLVDGLLLYIGFWFIGLGLLVKKYQES